MYVVYYMVFLATVLNTKHTYTRLLASISGQPKEAERIEKERQPATNSLHCSPLCGEKVLFNPSPTNASMYFIAFGNVVLALCAQVFLRCIFENSSLFAIDLVSNIVFYSGLCLMLVVTTGNKNNRNGRWILRHFSAYLSKNRNRLSE